ncbi:MAG: hypothetical protein AAGA03_03615, partial [Planctomycetota bacterium]
MLQIVNVRVGAKNVARVAVAKAPSWANSLSRRLVSQTIRHCQIALIRRSKHPRIDDVSFLKVDGEAQMSA